VCATIVSSPNAEDEAAQEAEAERAVRLAKQRKTSAEEAVADARRRLEQLTIERGGAALRVSDLSRLGTVADIQILQRRADRVEGMLEIARAVLGTDDEEDDNVLAIVSAALEEADQRVQNASGAVLGRGSPGAKLSAPPLSAQCSRCASKPRSRINAASIAGWSIRSIPGKRGRIERTAKYAFKVSLSTLDASSQLSCNKRSLKYAFQMDLYDYLSAQGSIALERSGVSAGRADLYIPENGFRFVIEVKRLLDNWDNEIDGFIAQTAAYQQSDVRLGFLAVLDLTVRPPGTPHFSDCLFTRTRVFPGADIRHVVVARVPGNRRTPSQQS
jgi:hypothetical protein